MISAVILAAGLSTRMGRPKLSLPWGSTTVIGQVVTTLMQARVDEIVVVTGGARLEVEAVLNDVPGAAVRTVFNPRYTEDDMLVSLQAGIGALSEKVQAVLVVLGDQPQIEVETVQALVETYRSGGYPLIVPSYHMRRGHPWMVDHALWVDLLSVPAGSTMREFLNTHSKQITYLPVDSPGILGDLDTPEEYEQWKTLIK
jgi:molybdenum cofactor cytidylyltransferase